MSLYRWILQLLFPARCVLCRRVLSSEEKDLCSCCRTEAKTYLNTKTRVQFLDSFTAVWYYEDNVRASLLRYKFHGARGNAVSYGHLLAEKLQEEHPGEYDLLTWVPVSSLRRLHRGYDQAALLARSVGRILGMPPVHTVKKIRHNARQSGIRDSALRRANVRGAYTVTDPDLVRGKRVLILDDIFTTGATVGECARVLRQAGAKEVHCAAVAAARKR